MSECNYCTNERLKKTLPDDQKITYIPSSFLGGTDVYISPKDVDVTKLTEKEKEQYFRVWFMRLGNHCEC